MSIWDLVWGAFGTLLLVIIAGVTAIVLKSIIKELRK